VNGSYAVVRCRPAQSLRAATLERDGFETPAEAARWRRANRPGRAFQVCRVIGGDLALLTTQDDLEIGKEESRP
jgi:hypothetical protein